MLTWAMAWMMVRLGEATGYLLVLSIFGDVLLGLFLVAMINAVIKTMIAVGVGMVMEERGNGTPARNITWPKSSAAGKGDGLHGTGPDST